MTAGKKTGLAALILCVAGTAVLGAEPGRMVLRGHVPAVVAHLTPQANLPATNRLHLAIGLPLRNEEALNQLLQELYDPASPGFHKFLTPEEFTARFGPTASDYQAVMAFAETNGFAITGTPRNRLLLDVEASATNAGRAFRVTLRTYRHPTEARVFFAPDTEPSVPTNLPVIDIEGLSDFARPFPKSHVMRPAMMAPRNGSAPDGSSYFGDDFRNAYVPGTTLTGAGQMVGLLQFDGFYSNDIATYATTAGGGRTNIVIQTVLLDGFNGVPTMGANSGNGEVSLDIEMAMAMAPGLAKIVVFEAPNNTAYFNDILNAMAASNQVKNLSCSWGGGGPNATSEGIFKTFAAQGQSFFNASGDSDAFTGAVPFPSESTNITQVGGTTLTMNGTGASYASETVWNWDVEYGSADNGIGSSGGISTTYQIPSWQLGLSMAANGGSTTMRNIPDVALTADHVFVDYTNGHSAWFGGTSCAAPLWAGFMALVNQQLVTASGSATNSVGFINPAVYEIARESIYNAAFHDITTGNNAWSGSPNAFYAVPGYDLCTGLGTPAGTNLINALVNPDPLGVVPNAGFNAVGSPAGVFNPTAQAFYLTNVSAVPLTWSLINTSAWLNASSGGGTLAAGAVNAVVVSLNTVASNLPAGTYSAGLWFSNVTSGVAHSRFFTLTVSDPLGILPTNNFSFFGPAGGPFYPGSQSVVITNLGAATQNWTLINTSTWLSISAGSGSIAGNSSVSVTVSTNAATAALTNGTYNATLLFSNQTSHVTHGLVFAALVGQSLVPNGGFETGDFTGWTLSGNSSSFVVTSSSTYVHSGVYGLDALANSLGYITQNLPTAPGQTYQLSFWFLVSSTRSGQQLQANWNGTAVYNTTSPSTSWTNQKLIVTATSTNTQLQFGLNSASSHSTSFGLDDISVTPVNLPVITQQPASQTNLVGSNVVFTAAASGTAPLGYQWRTNGVNLVNGGVISGASSNTLTLTAISANNAGNYTVVVTNAYGSVTSSVAVLTVALPPAITSSSLTNRAFQCGSNTNTFAVVNAAGTAPLSYQWSLDGAPVLNATNTSYSITNLHLPNHTISVAITNLFGSLTSNVVLTVQDTLAPAISLAGANPFYVELGGAFSDPGATATDVCAGAVSVIASGAVNTNSVGTNTLIYKAGDGNGNTNTATRTVIVRDTTPPTVLWSFTNLVVAANSNCVALMTNVTGTNFILATDLSGALTITQSPTNNAILFLGTNPVIITVKDVSGNAAHSTNTMIVQDQTPPAISLTGGSPVFSELGNVFVDPGAIANDTCAGAVPVTVSGTVNTNSVGTNTLNYTATDSSGNTNTATRTVIVRDTTPPTILWSFTNLVLAADTNCSAVMPDVTGTNFILATDLSSPLTILQSPTNSFVLSLGTNTVVISVADTFGNTAYSTNTVVVQDQTPPVVVLNGGNPVYVELGGAFSDPGAMGTDICAGLVPVTVSGSVNTNAVGTNTLTYTASDGNGNTSSAPRAVIVLDTTPPSISWSFTNLVLVANSNCVAPMPDVTGTNFILATDLSGALTITQSPTNNLILPLGTNTVVIAVADASGNVAYSTNTIIVQDETPPVILSQPQNLTNLIGTTAIFSVAAIACTPLVFQWYSNNSALTVPTNTTLALSNLTLAAAGNYFVVASANGGSSTSAVAMLTVNLIPPAINAVAANPDGSFNLNLTGSPGYTYILEATTNLIPANWLPIATNTLDTNGTLPFTDPSATNYQQQFYRLRLEQ